MVGGLLLALSFALPGAIPTALAKPALPHTPVWESWRPMGAGFVARRHVPAGFEQPAAQRRSAETQLRKRGLAVTAAVTSAIAPSAFTRARSSAAAAAPVSETDSAWFYTDDSALYSVTMAELAEHTGLKRNKLRQRARQGRFSIIAHDGSPVSWTFDAAAGGRLLFTGEAYEDMMSKGNAYRWSLTQCPRRPEDERGQQGQTPVARAADPVSRTPAL